MKLSSMRTTACIAATCVAAMAAPAMSQTDISGYGKHATDNIAGCGMSCGARTAPAPVFAFMAQAPVATETRVSVKRPPMETFSAEELQVFEERMDRFWTVGTFR